MPSVLYEKDGRIARIILNRPSAIDLEMPAALEDVVKCADGDPDVHVIILSGSGRAFCAGYDLNAFAEAEGTNADV